MFCHTRWCSSWHEDDHPIVNLPSNPMLNLIYGTDTTRIIVVTAMVTTEPMAEGKMIMMILNVTVGNPMTQTPAPVRVG